MDTGVGIPEDIKPKLFNMYATFDHNNGINIYANIQGVINMELVQDWQSAKNWLDYWDHLIKQIQIARRGKELLFLSIYMFILRGKKFVHSIASLYAISVFKVYTTKMISEKTIVEGTVDKLFRPFQVKDQFIMINPLTGDLRKYLIVNFLRMFRYHFGDLRGCLKNYQVL